MGSKSVLVCGGCKNEFRAERFSNVVTTDIENLECPNCGRAGNVRWVVKLVHRDKTIGRLEVENDFRLDREVEQEDTSRGKSYQDPRILHGTRVFPTGDGDKKVKTFWFPYWITIDGTKRYGQFAPMIQERALVELLEKAIEGGAFSPTSKSRLRKALKT